MVSHVTNRGPSRSEYSTSLSLLERACERDHDAWRRMCVLYGPLVYRWARRAGLQDSDAADIGQEVFRTLHQRLPTYDHRRVDATFRGWLHGITRNKIGDFQRRQRRQPNRPVGGSSANGTLAQLETPRPPERISPDEGGTASEAEFDAEAFILRRLIGELESEFEPRTWRAFWLAAVEDQPHDEIAAELGMSSGAVRQAKYRVLRRIRHELGWAAEASETT